MAELIKSIIIDECDTGWKISNRGYTIDTWGRKSYGTLNRTAGYLQVCINKKKFLVHRLVAKHFVANNGLNPDGTPIKGKAQVNHKNENPFCNDAENLEWCDNKYNNNYGTKNIRQSKATAKYYRCVETGEVAQPQYFADKFNTTKQAVRNAANPKDHHTHANGYHFERSIEI